MSVFRLAGGREKLNGVRTKELLIPLEKCIDDDECDKYTTIIFSGKSFSEEAAKVAASVLVKLRDVRTVNFSDTIAGQHEEEAKNVLRILCTAIEHYPLVELNLSDNALGLKGVNACAPALSHKPLLQRLYFNNNGLQGDAVARITELILLDNPNCELTTFHIFNNLLTDSGGIAVGKLFRHCPKLVDVRVATTRISNEGGLELVKALHESNVTTLQYLDLSDNSLGEEAGALLVSVVDKQPNLRLIRVGDSGVGEESVMSIIQCLSSGERGDLEDIDLNCCDLESQGARAFARMVETKPNLRCINLENNGLRAKGAVVVLESVVQLKKLEELNLKDNQITTSGLARIVELFPQLESIKKLSLNGNMFKEPALSGIREAVAQRDMIPDEVLGTLSDNDDEYSVTEVESDGEMDALMEKMDQATI